jgi:hypothetical protein
MAKIRDLFQSRFLRADDLGTGRARVLIEAVRVESLHGTKKPVVYFRGKHKALVLNQTRARQIATVLGSEETDDWIGCMVSLYVGGATVNDEDSGQQRRVRMICVDERPDSAQRRPAPDPPGKPLTAEDVPKW